MWFDIIISRQTVLLETIFGGIEGSGKGAD
jgi:hypothetical protein